MLGEDHVPTGSPDMPDPAGAQLHVLSDRNSVIGGPASEECRRLTMTANSDWIGFRGERCDVAVEADKERRPTATATRTGVAGEAVAEPRGWPRRLGDLGLGIEREGLLEGHRVPG